MDARGITWHAGAEGGQRYSSTHS